MKSNKNETANKTVSAQQVEQLRLQVLRTRVKAGAQSGGEEDEGPGSVITDSGGGTRSW